MFEAAVTKFVKSTGDDVLICVPSVEEATLCRPFYIVSKKKPRWFWQSARYSPTDFMIHDLMTKKDHWEDGIHVERTNLMTYNSSHKFSIHGKVGGKLSKLFSADLEGADSVTIAAKFGAIDKLAVDEPTLMNMLGKRQMDMNNSFVKQHDSKRRVLCIIVGCVQLATGGSISRVTSKNESSSIDTDKVVSTVTDVDEDESVSSAGQCHMQLPKDTILAYSVRELLVHSSGDLQMVVVDDASGGFIDKESTSAKMTYGFHPEDSFNAILNLDPTHRSSLRSDTLHLCAYPEDVLVVNDILEKLVEGDTVDWQKSGLIWDENRGWINLLTVGGFKLQETSGAIGQPDEQSGILDSVYCLVECLAEMNSHSLTLLSDCTDDVGKPLLYLLTQALKGEKVKHDDHNISVLFSECIQGEALLQSLGFEIGDVDVVPPGDQYCELHAAARVVYTLWGEKEDVSHRRRCQIL